MADTFRCGHPKTPANTRRGKAGVRCDICRRSAIRKQTEKARNARLAAGEHIGLPTDGSGWEAMVKYGSQRLGAAIDRMLGRVA